MSNVNSYTSSQPVVGTSKFLGSDALGETVNYAASDVATYVLNYANGAVSTKTGAYTVVLADLNTFIQYGTASGTITLPASTNTDFPVGGSFQIQFTVAGTMTISAGSGATLNGTGSISTQWQVKTVKRISATVWTLY